MIAARMRQAAAVCVAIALAAACTPRPEIETPAEWSPVPIAPYLGETVMGDPAAPVEIIEYASTTCGHCKAFHEMVLPELKAAYIDAGTAKLVYRVLPTQPGHIAMAGAAVARCAGEDHFFAVIDDLFANQEAFVTAATDAQLQTAFIELGERHGLNEDEVRTCVQSEEISQLIIAGVEASPDFVDSTPTLIVNGRHVEDYSFASLAAEIDAELAAAAPAAD